MVYTCGLRCVCFVDLIAHFHSFLLLFYERDCISSSIYTLGHKKRATIFWTISSAFLNGFQHFVYQRKKE